MQIQSQRENMLNTFSLNGVRKTLGAVMGYGHGHRKAVRSKHLITEMENRTVIAGILAMGR